MPKTNIINFESFGRIAAYTLVIIIYLVLKFFVGEEENGNEVFGLNKNILNVLSDGLFFTVLILILSKMLLAEKTWRESTVKATVEHFDEFKKYLDTTFQLGDIRILVDKDEWIKERTKLIDSILESDNSNGIGGMIRATSSFYPIDNEGNDYFDRLSTILKNKDNGVKYKLLILSEPEEKLNSEMAERIESLNRVTDDYGWHFTTEFWARKNLYKSNIDILTYSDYLFINLKSGGGESPPREYIMVKNRKIADMFVKWFEAIWTDENTKNFSFDELKKIGYNGEPFNS